MKSHFTSKFFIGNRKRLRELAGGGAPIVITANGLLQRNGDTTFDFTQDATFWYLTGINEQDVVLVICDREEYLILPKQSEHQVIFDSSSTVEELSKRSGIARIYEYKKGWELLAASLKKSRRMTTMLPPPAYVEWYGMYTNPARTALLERVKGHLPDIKLDDATPYVARQRMIKQSQEIAAIQSAIDVTIATLTDVFKAQYRHEYELEADITAGFRRRGSGHAFNPIVAAGKRACVLHNMNNNAKIGKDELIVVDVGAEVEHYAADITRTVALSTPTNRQLAVHGAVMEAQKFAFSLLKPGASFLECRDRTNVFVGEKLRELGLIKTVDDKSIDRYYPHSVSHFLGLDVHDIGDYTQPLQPGMVLTVEPGIYIPEEGIGVRIEDDVLITENGFEILSDKLSRKLS